jgi:hypothetical protein
MRRDFLARGPAPQGDARSARPPTTGALTALQRSLGNAGVARIAGAAGGPRTLHRALAGGTLARWSLPWQDAPQLNPDTPEPITREVELPPMPRRMEEGHAVRERAGHHPPTPDKFEPGDHVWYYAHPNPEIPRITADYDVPRDLWFPASKGSTDYEGHGMEVREFVIYETEVKEGWPHMRGKPGTTAWINNNPGNLTGDSADIGQIKGKKNWHGFLIFPTYQAGYDAIPKWLKAYGYYSKGILEAIEKYAPASDGNKPVEYANGIVRALRGETTASGAAITLQTKLEDLSDTQMLKVQDAIVQAEGTIEGVPHARTDENLPWEIRQRL